MTAESKHILNQWIALNLDNPFPSRTTKQELASKTNLTYKQITKWFLNIRFRQLEKKTLKLSNRKERKRKRNKMRERYCRSRLGDGRPPADRKRPGCCRRHWKKYHNLGSR